MKKAKKSLILYSIGLLSLVFSGHASAYSTEAYHDAIFDQDVVRYAATCNELDGIIASGSTDPYWQYIDITLSNDCNKNLVIPSGKKVRLSLKTVSGSTTNPDTGEVINTYVNGSLTNDGGDTITVENGATLVLSGEAINTTNEKAVINNAGRVFLNSANLVGKEDGYVVKNLGTITADLGTTFNNSQLSNNGTIYAIGGRYKYHDMSKYLVEGCRILEYNQLQSPDDSQIECPFNAHQTDYSLPEALPSNTSIKTTSRYSEIENARQSEIISTDSSVIEISGNNKDGFTITPKKTGSAYVLIQNYTAGAGVQYSVVYEVENANSSVKDYLANSLDDETIHKIFEAVLSHDKLFMEFDINKIDTENISDEYKELVRKYLNENNLLGYFDIEYFLKGLNSGNITSVTDLGNGDDDSVDVEIEAPKNLPEVKNGKTRQFFLVRIHEDGTKTIVDKIAAREENGRIRFKSGKFSTYALAYEDTDDIKAPNSGVLTIEEDFSKSSLLESALFTLLAITLGRVCVRKRAEE